MWHALRLRPIWNAVPAKWPVPILFAALFSALLTLSPSASAAVDVKGIDVSHWQGTIAKSTWKSLKNDGYSFVFIKATQGDSYVDPQFVENIKGAKAHGLLVGMYHFCDLDSARDDPRDAVNEAKHFLAVIKPYYKSGKYLPPVADVERFPKGLKTGQYEKLTSKWVQAFSDTIYNGLGVRPIIYTSKSKANSYYSASVAKSHKLWLAWWKGTGATSPPVAADTPLWGIWQFWQWSDGADAIALANQAPGLKGHVDRDVFYGTQAQLDALQIGFDGALPGDFNRDGKVDTADYIIWRKMKGQTVPVYSGADADGDTKVGDSDYKIWRSHRGQTSPSNNNK
ncbi:MAG TPA: GH25 family lysozyme [Lacipirellulaceae bacterium]|nr:GH25 family lysozyme [Lacipirellulaceae bacterium]